MSSSQTDDLVDDVEVILERLAGNVDALVDRAKPQTIARRSLSSVKARFVDADGNLRYETIVPTAVGAIAIVATLVGIRRLAR